MRVPFERLDHLVTVSAAVNGLEGRFALDTGIGLTLVSTGLAAAAGCEPTGDRFAGKRMSGQELEVPLAVADAVRVGPVERRGLEVGVLDLGDFALDGFLALGFFAGSPVTFDYANRLIVVESTASLAERRAAGEAVELRLERDGPSLAAYMELTIPDGRQIWVEVDTGSDALILDERFADEVGIDLGDSRHRRVEGTDETGHTFVRTFATLAGYIYPSDAPELAQTEPDVMFQRIIHDGLIGDGFLRRFSVTYDLDASSLILAPN